MNILEKEIEDLVFDCLMENPDLLSDRGLEHEHCFNYERQPDLGAYGRPDIIGYSIRPKIKGFRIITVEVIELKKDEINIDTLMQAARYATGVKRYFDSLKLKKNHVSISVILIGKSIELKSDFVFVLEQMSDVRAYTFELDIENGMRFIERYGYFKENASFEKARMKFSNLKEWADLHQERYYIQESETVDVDNPF